MSLITNLRSSLSRFKGMSAKTFGIFTQQLQIHQQFQQYQEPPPPPQQHQCRQYWREVLRIKSYENNKITLEDPDAMAQRSSRAQGAEGMYILSDSIVRARIGESSFIDTHTHTIHVFLFF
jgi:hypothetical protein